MSQPFNLVFNIERATANDLKAQKGHDNRKTGDLGHVDKSRTKYNMNLLGTGDPLKDANKVIEEKKAKLRKDNEKPYDRIVLSASPKYFKDKETLRTFVQNSMKFLKDEYGPGLAYVQLHLDEKTPHIHAVASTLVDRGDRGWIVSHSKHPSHQGRNSYAKMRQRAATALSLEYGEAGNKPKKKAVRDAEKEAVAIIAKAEAIKDDARGVFHIELMKALETTNGMEQESIQRLKESKKTKKAAEDYYDNRVKAADVEYQNHIKKGVDLVKAVEKRAAIILTKANDRDKAIDLREVDLGKRERNLKQKEAVLYGQIRSVEKWSKELRNEKMIEKTTILKGQIRGDERS